MSDLPTKPGPYYWRESDMDEWEYVIVIDPGNGHLYGHILHPDGVVATSLHDWASDYGAVGEWLPIPTAEELVELQAKAKMVDDGHEMMQLAYDANKMSLLVTPDNKEVVDIYTKATGYTCEPVTIIRKENRGRK